MGNDKTIAILRFVNYKKTNERKLKKVHQYITRPDSSPKEYQKSFYLNLNDPWHGMEVINNRWNPKGNRLFKHGVFSFGKADLKPKTAMEVTDKILSFYYNQYPIIYSIHTNIPRRIHAHFIMGMVNVCNGKKYEQSPKELSQFKQHFNEIVTSYGLPALKNYIINLESNYAIADEDLLNNQCVIEEDNSKYDSFDTWQYGLNSVQPVSQYQNYLQREQVCLQSCVENCDINSLIQVCDMNLYEWYLRGKGVK